MVYYSELWSFMICNGLLWCVMVCYGVKWCVMVCNGLLWSVLVWYSFNNALLCSVLSIMVCYGT